MLLLFYYFFHHFNGDLDLSTTLVFSRRTESVRFDRSPPTVCCLLCRTTYCCRSRCMTRDSLAVVSAHCILLFARCESGDFGIMAALLGCSAIISGGFVPAPSLLHTFKLPWSILLIVNCPCFNEFFIDCLSLALPR